VTEADIDDGKRIDAVLRAIVVQRKRTPLRRSQHLRADAGYRRADNLRIIETHGYIPHVVGRHQEIDRKRRDPKDKARRWVVEVAHSWFNRFRKLLARYEKRVRRFLALNHLAAAIIAFRKVPLKVNIIDGNVLTLHTRFASDERRAAAVQGRLGHELDRQPGAAGRISRITRPRRARRACSADGIGSCRR